MGISLRRFEGWEPRTLYSHDDDGRLVESTPEPEWDFQEQAWMLALGLYRKNRCHGCGGDLTETTDAKHEDRYHPILPVQCHRCAAFARAHEQYKDYPHPQSLLHRVELRRG